MDLWHYIMTNLYYKLQFAIFLGLLCKILTNLYYKLQFPFNEWYVQILEL